MRYAPQARIVGQCVTVLLAVLLAACGQVAASHTSPTPTLPPLPTPLPTQPPAPTVAVIPSGGPPIWGVSASWSHANLPTGFGMQFHDSDLKVAASDGKTAYSCAVAGNATQPGHPHVVVTHDGGVSWAYVTDIPVTWYACAQLVVDMLDPTVVVAAGDFGGGPQEATFDGGASWLTLPTQEAILQLATRGQSAYALIETPANGNATVILAESADHLRTWREIDANLASMNLRSFWVNPGNGALMLQTYDKGLWTSTDDGANWRQMGIPEFGIVDYMVQQPVASQPWRLCAMYYASQNDAASSLICTADGGKSWFTPPAAPLWQMAGIADDGALLVYDQSLMLYRLPAGGSRWQKLGEAPHSGCCIAYAPSSKGDMLWVFPAESDGAGAPPDSRAIYRAVYPY